MEEKINPTHFSSLEAYLSAVFKKKALVHSNFSKASFAKSLGISPSTLSNVLSGRRKLSRSLIQGIGKRLNWTSESFLHVFSLGSDVTKSEEIDARKEVHSRLVLDTEKSPVSLSFISRVLVEAVRIPKFSRDPLELSDGLELSRKIIENEMKTLLNRGVLAQTHNGSYARIAPKEVITPKQSSSEIRSFYRKMCTVAERKVRPDNLDRRYFGTETLAFDPLLMPEAKSIINRCLDELAALSERSQNYKSVYHVNIQFFDVLEDKKCC